MAAQLCHSVLLPSFNSYLFILFCVFQVSQSPLLLPPSLTCILPSFLFLSPCLFFLLSNECFPRMGFVPRTVGKGWCGQQTTQRSFLRDLTSPLCSCIFQKSNETEQIRDKRKKTTKSNNDGMRSQGHMSLEKAPLDKMPRGRLFLEVTYQIR